MLKVTILEVISECFGSRFWFIFDEVYVQVLVTFMSMTQHVLLKFSSISCGLGTLLGDYFSNTLATLLIFSRG